MVLDVPIVESDDEEDESVFKSEDEDGSIRRPKGLRRLHISRLLRMVLQDAQTRLFFKAQSTIQAEIRYYVPKPEDLAYPEKLVGALGTRNIHMLSSPNGFSPPAAAQNLPSTGGLRYPEKESIGQIFQVRSLDKQDTWYPTLQKTLWVLSQLHDFVKVRASLPRSFY